MFTLKYLFYSTIYVKIIVIALLVMLVLVVAMALSKFKRMAYINNYIKEFEKTFWSGISLDQFYEANKDNLSHPLGMIFKAVFEEWQADANLRTSLSAKGDIKERMLNVAHTQKVKILQTCEHYLDALTAFIKVSPFVGLLGTIFGVMDVFYNVDLENGLTITSASYGIGGSLICLVCSLFVVILSMFVYWFFDMKLQSTSDKIDAFIVDFLHILGRTLDGTAINGAPAPDTSSGTQLMQPLPAGNKEATQQPVQENVSKPPKKARPVDDDI